MARSAQRVYARHMKRAITIRIDPELLKRAREAAQQDNRTLTNLIETALKERLKIAPKRPSKRAK